MITYTVSGALEARDFLKNLEEQLDIKGGVEQAGAILLNRIRTRYLAEEGPDGPWIPSYSGIRRRSRGGTGTLFDTGRLFRSIQLYKNGMESTIGTDVDYAPDHQYGLKGNPVRVFLGFSEEDTNIAASLILKRIGERINGS